MLKKLLYFSSVAEIGTGLALMFDPQLVVTLLLGAEMSGASIPLGRCFGIALLALGLACWPSEPHPQPGSPAVRALLVYDVLIALFLVYLFAVVHLEGVLLWPAVALHGVMALLLVFAWRNER